MFTQTKFDFVAHVNRCSVITQCDSDFGDALTHAADDMSCDMPSKRIVETKLDYLEPDQRQPLLQLLDEYSDRFSDQPSLCEAAVQLIQTTPDFVQRQMRPYRVPDAFKAEVERQVCELLDLGLFRTGPMASPIVCAAKKKSGNRIVCNYGYLNSYTAGDAFPMSAINEFLRKSVF